MTLPLWLAALVAIFSFWLHTVVGHLQVFRPMQRLGGSPIARGTTAVCWHLTTFLLGAQAIYLAAAAIGNFEFIALTWTLVVLNGAAAGLFLAVSRGAYGRWTTLPQWSLLGPIAIFTAWHRLDQSRFE